jgi:hypothetical protein
MRLFHIVPFEVTEFNPEDNIILGSHELKYIPVVGSGPSFRFVPERCVIERGEFDDDGRCLAVIRTGDLYSRYRYYELLGPRTGINILASQWAGWGLKGRVNEHQHYLAEIEPGAELWLNTKYDTMYHRWDGTSWFSCPAADREGELAIAFKGPSMGTYQCYTLRGTEKSPGIGARHGKVLFEPRWGFIRDVRYVAYVIGDAATLDVVDVWSTPHGVVLRPSTSAPTGDLVLVQNYTPGCGMKKYPSYWLAESQYEGVTVLTRIETNKGSGREEWVLVAGPKGWPSSLLHRPRLG